ncbi:MAG TPA: hypothetical protein VGA88_00120, partial [Burkholderiales bacterium]
MPMRPGGTPEPREYKTAGPDSRVEACTRALQPQAPRRQNLRDPVTEFPAGIEAFRVDLSSVAAKYIGATETYPDFRRTKRAARQATAWQ